MSMPLTFNVLFSDENTSVNMLVTFMFVISDEEYFSERASNILQEITESKVLQAQVVNRAEDGLPYIHIYRVGGNRVRLVGD